MNPDRDIHLGNQADQLLQSQMFKDVWEALETEWVTAWRNSPPVKSDERERLWQLLHALDAVKDKLATMVVNARVASEHVKNTEQAERVRRLNVVPA